VHAWQIKAAVMLRSAPGESLAQAVLQERVGRYFLILIYRQNSNVWAGGKLGGERLQSYVEAIGVCLEQESVEDDASPAHLRLTKLVHEIVRARLPA